jgi:putative ABC transport system permease protein
MKFLPFILRHLRHNWIRTGSTAAAIAICIFLFCTLQTFVASLNGFLSQGSTRLITRHNVSLVFPMPNAYEEKIAAVPGVKRVAASNYFGGLRDLTKPADEFTNFAVEAENFMAMYPEFILSEAEKQAFLGNQQGCVVGKALAQRFDWKVGDAIELESNIAAYRTAKALDFIISAIYQTDQARFPGTNDAVLFFHYKYLYEATGRKSGVSTFRVEIPDPRQAGTISQAIDSQFENSDTQTHTETEAQYRASLGVLGGNLAILLQGIALAVMFTILLVTANTMSMAVRERRTEIGVLKTFGFPGYLVMSLILGEGCILGAIGALTGLLLGRFLINVLPDVPVIGEVTKGFPHMSVPPAIAIGGVGIGLLLGLTAGFVPALLAYKGKITDLLRQV